MEKQLAKDLCGFWNKRYGKGYEATRTHAFVEAPSVPNDKDYDVVIKPDGINIGNAFHHIEELSDVSRVFGVNVYVVLDRDSGTLHARLF